MLRKVKLLVPLASGFLPLLALAQIGASSLGDAFSGIVEFINTYIIPFIIAIALVVFLWGLVQFVTAGGDEEKRAGARNTMIYGIIALFVMVSVWGLVNLLQGSFTGLDTNPPPLPEVQQPY